MTASLHERRARLKASRHIYVTFAGIMASFDYTYQNAFRCNLCVTHERFFTKGKILNTIACLKAFWYL